jgi:uncharacterized membrane protein
MDLTMKTTATALLGEDHRNVQVLHQRFLAAEDAGARAALAEDLFKELEIHGRLEESLAYPSLARAGAPADLVERFGHEHGEIKRLISESRLSQREDGGPSAERDARVAQIMAALQRHVAEEETEAFPLLAADPLFDQERGAELAKLRLKLRMFPPIHRRIDLEVPVRVAYNQWTQFETFPSFLDNVKQVRQLDDSHVQWQAQVAGKEVCWTAEIYQQIPDQRIAWSSVDGAPNTGSVTFRPLTAVSTRMLVEVTYEPQGLLEDLGAMLGMLGPRLGAALERFKATIEARPRETGAWRGKIDGNPVQPQLSGLEARDEN